MLSYMMHFLELTKNVKLKFGSIALKEFRKREAKTFQGNYHA